MASLSLKRSRSRSYVLIDQDGPVSPLPSPKMWIKNRFASSKNKRRSVVAAEEGPRFKLFLKLPYELQCDIAKFLSFKDMCMLQISSQLLRQISSENSVWKSLYQRHWNLDSSVIEEFGKTIKDWQAHFKFQYCIHKTQSLIKSEKIPCATKPQTRYAHTSAVSGNHIYYIGGQFTDSRSNEIWDYNFKSTSFAKVTVSNHDPSKTIQQTQVDSNCSNFEGIDGKIPNLARHQSVAWKNKVYTFGGYDYTYFYNLAVFDVITKTWTYPKVNGDIPVPRSNHASALVGNKFYIFGGSIGDNVDKYYVTNDFYCLDLPTLTWKKIDTSHCDQTPTKRVGHVMKGIGKHIYLFGGGIWGRQTGWTDQYNDLYVYSIDENTWTLIQCKEEEKPQVSTYPYAFTIKNNLFIFGGTSKAGSNVTNKLYVWDTFVRKWKELEVGGEAISPRSIGCAEVIDNEVIIWGGYCGGLLPTDNDFFRMKLNFPCKLKCIGMS